MAEKIRNPFNPFTNRTSTNDLTVKTEKRHTDPTPERYTGVNAPYRGTQNHGVPVEINPYVEDIASENLEDYEPVDKNIPPIPVTVVNNVQHEKKVFQTLTASCLSKGITCTVLGRDRTRTRVVLNCSRDILISAVPYSAVTFAENGDVTYIPADCIRVLSNVPFEMFTTEPIYVTPLTDSASYADRVSVYVERTIPDGEPRP